MGSLLSFGSAPKIVSTPQELKPLETTASTTTTTETTVSDEPVEQTAEEARVENILNRSRGTSGTVRTSYTGVLSPSDETSLSRKTLLGE